MKRNDVPRIALIGTGRMADLYHLPSQKHLESIGKSRLVAVCDVKEEAAANAARKFKVPAAYHDIDTMLKEEQPDGVVMVMPVPVTPIAVSHVLKKGYKVMMEKPPGDSVKKCMQLVNAAKKSRTKNMVAFNRRFCPVVAQGKEEALKRGKIKGANGLMYRTNREEWEFFIGTGIHSLDAMRFLGGDMERVETDARPLAKKEQRAFSVFIEYSNGGHGTLNIRPQAGVQLERYEVFSPQTTVLIHAGVGWLVDTPGSCTVYEGNKKQKIADALAPYRRYKDPLLEAMVSGFYGENAAFVAALRGEGPFTPSVEESLQSVAICEAVQHGRSWKRR
ncbi:MAG TPA: Gfo/Idh/MocA family oxidoreductase [Planctomycetota bacterium]|nr:Gfo/Idh/MocA family oxidoreductase [Planctomycetota bacterium]